MTLTNEQIQALQEQAECICGILENIAGYEPGDIDGDDVELRFETEDGFDTGCNVSIVEQCQKSADVIRSLLAEREADKALIAEQDARLIEYARIATENAVRTLTVKLPKTFWYEHDDLSRDVAVLEKRLVKKALHEACAAAGITLKVGGEDGAN